MSQQKFVRTCSIWRALNVIGDKPTLLILESAWLGSRRFSAIQNQTGLLKTVISDRLSKLVEAGCFKKQLYSERPKRYEYRGSQKFYDLYLTALAMLDWERKWGQQDGKVRISLKHGTCGQTTKPIPVCGKCRVPIDPRDVSWAEGPGVGVMLAEYSRRRRGKQANSMSSTTLFDEIADIIGDRWSTLIIRSLFTNLNSFQDICEDTGIATNILSERLDTLCEMNLIKKTDGVYRLTEKGRDIYPILLTLMEWGDKWYPSPEGPPLLLTHKPCSSPLKAKMACSDCGVDVIVGEVTFAIDDLAQSSAR